MTLPSAERRSITGRWKTMACRRGIPGNSSAFQVIAPEVGASRP
jgi:hypothetical protein